MRDKTFLFVIPAVLLLVSGNLFLTPYLHRREVIRTVTAVLDGWAKIGRASCRERV